MMNGIWQSLCLDLVNSNVCAKVYQTIPKGSRDRTSFTFFSEFQPRQILDQCQMTFDNLLGVLMNGIWQTICLDIVNSNVYAKFYQNIPNVSRDTARFTFFFLTWTSAKPRPAPNEIWQSLGLHIVDINVYAKFHHNIPFSSRDRAIFTFLRIWSSAKPRPTINVISQSFGLELVNINMYAKLYQIFRLVYDLSIFFAFCLGTFSKFEPRQNLDQCQMTFDNLLGVMMGGIWQSICLDLVNSNVYAKFYQNIPKGSRDRARFTFFRIWTSAKPRPIPNDIW